LTLSTPSVRLDAVRQQAAIGPVTLGILADRLGHAATGTLLLLCGLAGLVPGLAVVLGVPLCLLATGLLLGRDDAWLPSRLRDRPIAGHRLVGAVARLAPRLRWLERRLRPRLAWATRVTGRRAAGLAALEHFHAGWKWRSDGRPMKLLANLSWSVSSQAESALICGILIILPVPFGNTAPAISVIVLAAGILAHDGIAVLLGLACATLALALDAFLLLAGYEVVQRLTGWFA